ncbi:MAG: DNRLRE domain-containing protein [Verrucomicrobiales bacterium]|nr:DNRLRE domain-containing protein [Verrucomicrobiales bacterium]
MSDALKPAEKWSLLEQWDQVQDGSATAEVAAALDRRLRQDEAARQWLASALLLEAELRYEGETLLAAPVPISSTEGGAPVAGVRAGWIGRAGLRWSHAVAALLAAVLTWLGWSLATRQPEEVATLERARGCKWGNSALPTLEGARLPAGMLDLVEGMATLRFESGAEVVLEAPARVELLSKMACRVAEGTVVADVPESAIGFTVHTPRTTVVDYGTRFGVTAGADGKCLVHVLEGLVEVEREGEETPRRLHGGERVDYGDVLQDQLQLTDAPEEPERATRPPSWEQDGWWVITTGYGRGKDSWIQSNAEVKVRGGESFLRVKYTSLDSNLQRKAYLGFDLSSLRSPVAEAELLLEIDRSELGYGTLVPDATFVVYGVTAEEQDGWEEAALSWDAAPAHQPGAPSPQHPIANQAVELGRFQVAQGQQSGVVRVSGAALTDFLNADTNGLATFVICRETDESARNGLVHAFASKEHPRLSPPTLRLRLRPDN